MWQKFLVLVFGSLFSFSVVWAQVGLSVNGGTKTTNNTQVSIHILTGYIKEMQISDDKTFPGAKWEPFKRVAPWKISEGDGYKPIFLRFRDRDGNESRVYETGIVLDTKAPVSNEVIIAGGNNYINRAENIEITVISEGATQFQVSEKETFQGAAWISFREKMLFSFTPIDGKKTLFARFKDDAGNLSEVVKDVVTLDTEPPGKPSVKIRGKMVVTDPTSGQKYLNKHDAVVDLSLRAEGAEFMKISTVEGFYGAKWRKYDTALVNLPLENFSDGEYKVTVQFMDKAKNVSHTVSDKIIVDTASPSYCQVTINRNEPFAIAPEVMLQLRALEVQSMMLSNFPDFKGATWEPYRTEKPWKFEKSDGVKTVYARFRDAAGNETKVFSDDIIMDLKPPTQCTIAVNNGDKTTKVPYIKVQVGAHDALHMQVSDRPDFTDAVWKLYIERPFEFVLDPKPGPKTVYARFRDESGNISETVKASITLEAIPLVTNGLEVVTADGYCNHPERKVQLRLSAKEATEVLIGNDSTFAGSVWQPYEKEQTWTLSQGDGPKTVFAKFRSHTETESRVFRQSLILDTTPPTPLQIKLNDGKPGTLNQYLNVQLEAMAADFMQVSDREDFDQAVWRRYHQRPFNFICSPGSGIRTIYARFKDEAGNISPAISATVNLEVPPGSYRITINNGQEFTNQPDRQVTLSILATFAEEMMLSNFPDFKGARWEPFAESKTWVLTEGDGLKTVYAKFKSHTQTVSGVAKDQIVLDINPPEDCKMLLNNGLARTQNFYVPVVLSAKGATSMQVSRFEHFTGANWMAYSTDPFLVYLGMEGGEVIVYARFMDASGFHSPIIKQKIQVDIVPAQCRVTIDQRAPFTNHPQKEVMLTLNANNAREMMISNHASFQDGVWEPYTLHKNWQLEGEDGHKTVHVKFRSHTLTESLPLKADILLDRKPPQNPQLVVDMSKWSQQAGFQFIFLTATAMEATQYQVSEAPDFHKARWEGYTGLERQFVIGGEGERKIYARFRDRVGNISSVVSATIQIDVSKLRGARVLIAHGAKFVNSLEVPLQLYAPDAQSMKLANDPASLKTASWQPYAETINWELAKQGGSIKTVYVQFKDGAGNITQPITATAELDQVPPQKVQVKLFNDGYTCTGLLEITLQAQGAHRVMFSDRADFAEAFWQRFAPSMVYELTGADGPQTLYIKVADEAGNEVPVIQLPVVLDREPPLIDQFTANKGAAYTNQVQVHVAIQAQGADEMILSNTGTFGLPYKWERYQPGKKWKLEGVDGPKTIYLKLRDKAGNESEVQQVEVLLDTEAPVVYKYQINGGETATDNGSVTLHLKVKPSPVNPTLPDAQFIQVADSPEFTDGDWQPFQETVPWAIKRGKGHQKVFMRLKDAAGNITFPFSDLITIY